MLRNRNVVLGCMCLWRSKDSSIRWGQETLYWHQNLLSGNTDQNVRWRKTRWQIKPIYEGDLRAQILASRFNPRARSLRKEMKNAPSTTCCVRLHGTETTGDNMSDRPKTYHSVQNGSLALKSALAIFWRIHLTRSLISNSWAATSKF